MLNILPYGLFRDNLGGSIYITKKYTEDIYEVSGEFENRTIHSYYNNEIVLGQLNKPIIYKNNNLITHREMIKVIKYYERIYKLKRICE